MEYKPKCIFCKWTLICMPISKYHLFDGADASMIEKLEKLRNTFGKEKFDFIIY